MTLAANLINVGNGQPGSGDSAPTAGAKINAALNELYPTGGAALPGGGAQYTSTTVAAASAGGAVGWSSASGVAQVTPSGGTVETNNSTLAKIKAFLRTAQPVTPFALVTTTLSADINSAATSIGVTTPAGFPSVDTFVGTFADGVNTEYFWCYSGMGTKTWTVIRGYNGSTANAFTAALTTITWYPVAFQKGAINDNPMGFPNSGSVTFTGSVGGASSGTLTGSIQNGTYTFKFSNNNVRQVKVQTGTAVSWSPALTAGSVTTATIGRVTSPAGISGYNASTIAGQAFESFGPCYITQKTRLLKRPAVITANYGSGGLATLSVDSTSMFPQSGNFVVSTTHSPPEDFLVNVANATTLNVVTRAFNGTSAAAEGSATTGLQTLCEVDFLSNGGTQNFWITSLQNSGKVYLGSATMIGALKEYASTNPLCLNFIFDGQVVEFLSNGNFLALMIADGAVVTSANYVSTSGGGSYWNKFDFGSRKTRRITLYTAGYPAAMNWSPEDTVIPWDRSADPVYNFDGDSYAQNAGFTWQSVANGGGLGPFFEIMLNLGISQYDFGFGVGGAGISQQTAASLPNFPRPKYSAVNRISAIVAGPAPSIIFEANGHNDTSAATPPGIINSSNATVADAVSTSVTVTSSAGYPTTTLPFIMACETELMLVTQVNGNVWTVTRGYGNTTAASHSSANFSACSPQLMIDSAAVFSAMRTAWPQTIIAASHFWQTGKEAGISWYVRVCIGSAILRGLQLAGGYWVYIDCFLGTWQNSSGASGLLTPAGIPLVTGTGFGMAPGYAGTTGTNDGNADLFFSDDDVHPSNLGSRAIGLVVANAIRTGTLAL